MPALRASWAEINLDALAHNFTTLRSAVGSDVQVMAVVKADAYGHGAIEISKFLLNQGVASLAVSLVDEAVELRRAGIGVPILVFNYVAPERCDLMVRYGLTATVYEMSLARALSQAAVKHQRKVKVHVKVDTGMSRLGVKPEDAVELVKQVSKLPFIEVEGIYSHFATADAADKSHALRQFELFMDVSEALDANGYSHLQRHMANSAAAITMPDARFQVVRLGIALYGLYPSPEVKASTNLELKQVMSLKSRVSYVKEVPEGVGIGYGRSFIAARPSVIATIPIGYADGYARGLSHKAHVLIRGTRVPLAGNICMDQCMADATDLADVRIGDEVVLFGSQGNQFVSIDEVAAWLNTINYEIPCMVSRRVPRIYLKEQRVVAAKVYCGCE